MDEVLTNALLELKGQVEKVYCQQIRTTALQIHDRVALLATKLPINVPLEDNLSFNYRANNEELLASYIRSTTQILKNSATLAQVNNYRLIAQLACDLKSHTRDTFNIIASCALTLGALSTSLFMLLNQINEPVKDYVLGGGLALSSCIFVLSKTLRDYDNTNDLKHLMLKLSEQKLKVVKIRGPIVDESKTYPNDIENPLESVPNPYGFYSRDAYNRQAYNHDVHDEKTMEEEEKIREQDLQQMQSRTISNTNINGLAYHF